MINLYRRHCFYCSKRITIEYGYNRVYITCNLSNHYTAQVLAQMNMIEEFNFQDNSTYIINTNEGLLYCVGEIQYLVHKQIFGLTKNLFKELELIKLLT